MSRSLRTSINIPYTVATLAMRNRSCILASRSRGVSSSNQTGVEGCCWRLEAPPIDQRCVKSPRRPPTSIETWRPRGYAEVKKQNGSLIASASWPACLSLDVPGCSAAILETSAERGHHLLLRFASLSRSHAPAPLATPSLIIHSSRRQPRRIRAFTWLAGICLLFRALMVRLICGL